MGTVWLLIPNSIFCTIVQKLARLMGAIKFQETVFALPFAYSGMFLASHGWPTSDRFLWITVAMICARTLGMSANRIIDRNIDALNSRTSDRHLPSGKLGLNDMVALATISGVFFFYAAGQLNILALVLSPVAVAYLILCPYAKQFTWTANLILGGALAIAPSAAWIGIRGSLDLEPVLLSVAVASWASSFDILYHVQDKDHYVENGLYSIAQRFGVRAAFWWARILDAVALISLVGLGIMMDLGIFYYFGCLMAMVLLIYKHSTISPIDLSRMNIAFFRINAGVSSVIFIGTWSSVLSA